MTVFFDTETHCFAPGNQAPRVVCMQWCRDDRVARLLAQNGGVLDMHGNVGQQVSLSIGDMVAYWLKSGETLVGHNVAYDLACLTSDYPDLMPLVWQAYREDRIHDTMHRQKLADIGRGRYRTRRYDLGSVSQIHGGPQLNKKDPWRRRYGLLENVHLKDWPSFETTVLADEMDAKDGIAPLGSPIRLHGEEAIRYALLDAEATRAAYLGQEARYAPELLVDACSQGRKFWALQLASVWGIRTSARGVASLREGVETRIEQLRGLLVESGLLRPNGTRDTKAAKAHMVAVCEELGVSVAMTDGGKKGPDISLSSDACDATEDELLKAYTEYSSMAKTLANDVPMLEKGLVMPLHGHFDLADTGRTTMSKPNLQNIKRQGLHIRECIVPRNFDSRSYELDSGAKKG